MAKKKCRLDRKTDLTFLGVQKKKKNQAQNGLPSQKNLRKFLFPIKTSPALNC